MSRAVTSALYKASNSRGYTERTKTSKKVRGVAGVRDSEGFGRAVVEDGEAKEFRSDGVGFGVVEGRKTRDAKVKVRAVRILDAEVVHD